MLSVLSGHCTMLGGAGRRCLRWARLVVAAQLTRLPSATCLPLRFNTKPQSKNPVMESLDLARSLPRSTILLLTKRSSICLTGMFRAELQVTALWVSTGGAIQHAP